MRSALLLIPLLAVAGCGFRGVESLPLPGAADLGERPYPVTIEFADALDLVPHALCKVNDVTVGKVTAVELIAWRAEVVCTTRVVTRSRDDTLADLRHLRALLAGLDAARTSVARNLDTALTFPFPPSATGLLKGDYGNADVTVDLSPGTTLENVTR
ncbi:MlaD family protein [Nonomuraea sp. NPDC049152]|uniref:MlaD family protein n=1 Tax=Nonomuraea sp. NPDC049152 TaxID=3154350 RepID=UPI003409CA32